MNGAPKLADIGLVAETSDARSFVGTEGFIPPEGPGAPQADLYSLGKVLYEISTGNDRRDFPALPDAALAEIYRWSDYLFPSGQEAMTKAKEAALQALALDDSLAPAHKELGYVAAHLDRDFAKATNELKRAIELSPDYSNGHLVYAWLLLEMRRFEEAKKETMVALRLNPVFPRAWCSASVIFRAAGDLDEAAGQLRKALDLDPNYWLAFAELGYFHEEKGEYPQAIEMFRKARVSRGMEPEKAARQCEELRRAFVKAGAQGYWRKKLELADLRSNFGGNLYDLAVIHLHVGDENSAFDCLEEIERQKWDHVFSVNFDRRFDSVRSDPRFVALLRKLGLGK